MKPAKSLVALSVLAALALTACDDAFQPPGSNDDTTGSVAGVYAGSLTDSPSGATQFETLILPNGEYWSLYGEDLGGAFGVTGFTQGNGTANAGSFSSTDLVDFGADPVLDGTLQSTYDSTAHTIAGTITTSAGTTSFDGGPLTGSSYDFDAAPSLALLAGSWVVGDLGGISYDLEVQADGSFTFEESGGGCSGTGTFAADSSGKNLFQVNASFDDVPDCALPGGTAAGVALAYELTATQETQLAAALTDSGRDLGTALFGTRPTP